MNRNTDAWFEIQILSIQGELWIAFFLPQFSLELALQKAKKVGKILCGMD